jgi:hypothetical protein
MGAFAGTASEDSTHFQIDLKTCSLQSRLCARLCGLKSPFLTLGLLGGVHAVE